MLLIALGYIIVSHQSRKTSANVDTLSIDDGLIILLYLIDEKEL